MSESIDQGSDQKQSADAPKLTVEQLMAQVDALKKTNERIIAEHRKEKDAVKSYRELVEKAEKEKLEKEGDLSQKLEFYQKKVSELEETSKGLKQKTLKTNIYTTLMKHAGEVNDIDDLLNQPKYSHILKAGINEDELSLADDIAKEYVNAVLTDKPWLKKQTKQASAITNKPQFSETKANKTVNEMNTQELENFIKLHYS